MTTAGEMRVYRTFDDGEGTVWELGVREHTGFDHKGRFRFVARPADGGGSVELRDVRWNSEATARRTIRTMSEVEVLRRLRSARGREGARAASR